jgi:DnaJ-class molecular chaperone
MFAVGVLGYLIYNMIEASRNMEPNFYELLDVYPDADEARLKMAFRTFARRNHPDKVGPAGETLFIQVRNAYDALKNPVTRYAYDRWAHFPAMISTY